MKIETNIDNLKNYKIYLKIEQAVNDFLKKKGYLKVDLPVLSPALIPESYLEVFETEFRYLDKRQKLYLTPSPELFLKRLLVAGIGNCYYLGRSFRNSEPSSSWHQPEFTMLEFYKIGVNYLELANEILEMLRFISVRLSFRAKSRNLKKISPLTSFGRNDNRILFDKWEKMSVAEAFDKYAAINEKELFNPETFIKKAKSKGYKVDGATYKDLFSQILAAEVEPKLGKNGRPTLLYDYPRQLASLAKLSKDKKIAERCEFYINGLEVGGFCTELNDYKEQHERFFKESKKRKRSKLINHAIDKGFIEALKYGLPNCTGAGIGFERLVMIFSGVDSISKLKLIDIS